MRREKSFGPTMELFWRCNMIWWYFVFFLLFWIPLFDGSFYFVYFLSGLVSFIYMPEKKYLINGQLISKAIYAVQTSPKKQMDEFVLFAFLLFTTNISNSFVNFFGRIYGSSPTFWFYLTFKQTGYSMTTWTQYWPLLNTTFLNLKVPIGECI